MHIERTLKTAIIKASATFPAIILTGPRQVGKTTLLKLCTENSRNYISLDNLNDRKLAKTEPELFFKRNPPPILIDEVQYAPELFSYIKIICDQEQKSGLFWLTGSQKFHLMQNIAESLAGRVAILDLLGLSQREIANNAHTNKPLVPTQAWLEHARSKTNKTTNLMSLYKQIWLGSFPKIINQINEIDRDLFYSSYIQTYIERDVRDITNIINETGFLDFLHATAARTGQIINYADLASDANINHRTTKAWLNVLETSGIIYLLRPYHNNTVNRLIKTPKLYFLDTGLCSYLTKWQSPESLEAGAMSGAILETYVFTEILKSYWHNAKQPYFYFYRDKKDKEIDLLIEQDNILYPIEIKKTANPANNAPSNFKFLTNLNRNIGHGMVICLIDKDIPLSREVDAVPVGYI